MEPLVRRGAIELVIQEFVAGPRGPRQHRLGPMAQRGASIGERGVEVAPLQVTSAQAQAQFARTRAQCQFVEEGVVKVDAESQIPNVVRKWRRQRIEVRGIETEEPLRIEREATSLTPLSRKESQDRSRT